MSVKLSQLRNFAKLEISYVDNYKDVYIKEMLDNIII